jgi:NADH dehydrogenase
MRVVVVGGGYAGLSCLVRLASRFPESKRTLVDPGDRHLKRTRLQELLRRPLDDLRVPFRELADRFEFGVRRGRVDCGLSSLARYAREGRLPLGRRGLPFDALVVATGVPDRIPPARAADVLTVAGSGTAAGRNRLLKAAARVRRGAPPLAVIGAGPTGLQYLFELLDCGVPGPGLLLVDARPELLPGQPEPLRAYVRTRLDAAGVVMIPGSRMTSLGSGQLRVTGAAGRRSFEVSEVLFCPGPAGRRLRADACGRVLFRGRPLAQVFAAGDMASWAARGQDGRTAQAAVRKGRHVADNVRRAGRGRMLQEFLTPNLGFFLSMGASDAAGWVVSPAAVITGRTAAGLRDAIEYRYDLMLDGVDTFAAF